MKRYIKKYKYIIEFCASFIFGVIAYFWGSKDLTDALVWFLLPIIVSNELEKALAKPYISKNIKDLAMHLDNIKSINPEIYELYSAEINNIHDKISDSINSKLFSYSYTPDLKLYKIVCARLMKQFNGIDERDFFMLLLSVIEKRSNGFLTMTKYQEFFYHNYTIN